MHRNGQSGLGRFSLASFTLNGAVDSAIYIHCDVTLCDETSHSCKPLCDGTGGFEESDMDNGSGESEGSGNSEDTGNRRRRRRNANVKTLSSHPIFLHQPIRHI